MILIFSTTKEATMTWPRLWKIPPAVLTPMIENFPVFCRTIMAPRLKAAPATLYKKALMPPPKAVARMMRTSRMRQTSRLRGRA